ncbi:hypothetical protein ANANG_G00226210 [Anguilla anguilla]|uniref:Uncharacterized protein n=1 Tax=Anguilla anguilla TaxID=7936 RepID=A0A9D3LX95_ANGAN|nr:hypothetical protein ANANG_G00226210 [Anguilla anguilla]
MLQTDVYCRPYRFLVWNARAEYNCCGLARKPCNKAKNFLLKIFGCRNNRHRRGPRTHWIGCGETRPLSLRPLPLSPSALPRWTMPSAHSGRPLEEDHLPR